MQINQFNKSKGHIVGKRNFKLPITPLAAEVPVEYWDTSKVHSFTLTDDNKLMTSTGTITANCAISKIGATGKVYAEIETPILGGDSQLFGLCTEDQLANQRLAFTAYSWGWFNYLGRLYHDSAYRTMTGSPVWATTDVLQIAVDLPNNKLWIGKNGTWLESGDPGAGTGEQVEDADITGDIFIGYGPRYSGDTARLRMVESEFSYTIPSGFSAWGGIVW